MEEKETYTIEKVTEYIKESNIIEDVYSLRAVIESLCAWDYIKDLDEISVVSVLKVHKFILRSLAPQLAGRFRGCNVYINGRAGYPIHMIDLSIERWLKQANKVKKADDIRMNHVYFEFVHPFQDGNGRAGRLLMLWQRYKNDLPLEIIQAKTKYEDYYPWFQTKEAVERFTYSPGATK